MKIVISDEKLKINQDNINHIKNPNEWIPIPKSLEAITLLNQHGFYVVIATNQSGIGRGLFDFDSLNLIHGKMIKMLGQLGGSIDAIFYCPHTDEELITFKKARYWNV